MTIASFSTFGRRKAIAFLKMRGFKYDHTTRTWLSTEFATILPEFKAGPYEVARVRNGLWEARWVHNRVAGRLFND
jgi:hypothetical protein